MTSQKSTNPRDFIPCSVLGQTLLFSYPDLPSYTSLALKTDFLLEPMPAVSLSTTSFLLSLAPGSCPSLSTIGSTNMCSPIQSSSIQMKSKKLKKTNQPCL